MTELYLNDLTDPLTHKDVVELLNWLWLNNYTVTRPNIMGWMKRFRPELYRAIKSEDARQ